MATYLEKIVNAKYKSLLLFAGLLIVGLLYLLALVWIPTTFKLPDYNYPQDPAYWVGVAVGAGFILIPFVLHGRSMLIEKDSKALSGSTIP